MTTTYRANIIRRTRPDSHGIQTVSRLPSWRGMVIIRPWEPGDNPPGAGQRLERLAGGPAYLVGYRWSVHANAETLKVSKR